MFNIEHYDKNNIEFTKKLLCCFPKIHEKKNIHKIIYNNLLKGCCFCEIEEIFNFMYLKNLNYSKSISYYEILTILENISKSDINVIHNSNILFKMYCNYKSCGCNKFSEDKLIELAKVMLSNCHILNCYLIQDNYSFAFAKISKKSILRKEFELILIKNHFFNLKFKLLSRSKDTTINNLFSHYSQYGSDIKFIKNDLNHDRCCLNTIIYEKYLLFRIYSDFKRENPDKDISNINNNNTNNQI